MSAQEASSEGAQPSDRDGAADGQADDGDHSGGGPAAADVVVEADAVDAAESTAREQDIAAKYQTKLVAAEFRAAAAGKLTAEQTAALIEDIDPSKFLDDDGDVDIEKIARKIEILASARPGRPASIPDIGQGRHPVVVAQPGAAGLAAAQRRGYLKSPTT